MKTSRLTLAVFFSLIPAALQAQGVGVAAHVGSMGVGADFALHFSPSIGVRVGGNFVPADVAFDAGDISYDFNIPPRFTAMLDLHPGGSAFRISVGAMTAEDIDLLATPIGTVDVGGFIFNAADVGTLTAVLDTKQVYPYVGIGIGNPAGSAFGFFLDLGVGIWGTPDVLLSVSGPIATIDPTFPARLAVEQAELLDSVEKVTVYPVLSIGFSIGFGK